MTRNESLVSIITPAFNSERFIGSTIDSVKKQTYLNWEMIIIDDCSTDRTVELVEEKRQKDDRIKLIRLAENSGAAVARNAGINSAQGKFIAFLDSDDLWTDNKLEEQILFMTKNNYAFTFSSYSIMDEEGNVNQVKKIFVPKEVTYKSLLRSPGTVGCLTVILDKDKIEDVEMPNIKSRQDFALWLKILRSGKKAFGLNKTLAHYRKVSGSISSNKIKAAQKNWHVYRRLEKLNTVSASWYFANYAVRAIKKTYF
ncbi:glycosyltransferase family 2 protein [Aquibacillus saliphilus]|uniref:glycosyltransferase family 2 protein n=1 Tax=Aquibacillus saliphilus TaxID=1909422 RepID=UPI001CF05858|nr:glycosyltransferase family 2 protein [Aquibacillus saliphilus]